MLIPKGLIIYRAKRHQEAFPRTLKYGCFANSLGSSITREKVRKLTNPHRSYQTKLIKSISFSLGSLDMKTYEILTKCSCLEKVDIDLNIYLGLKLNIQVGHSLIQEIQRLLKSIKRIKVLEIGELQTLQKSPKTFKNLLLLNSLQELIFRGFQYSKDSEKLEPFTKMVKSGSKRKAWPKLKSLRIQPLCTDNIFDQSDQQFVNLLNLVRSINSCNDLRNCSSFQIELSSFIPEQASILCEISKSMQSLTRITASNPKIFQQNTQVFRHTKTLKKISLDLGYQNQTNIDLSVLTQVSSLTHFKIFIPVKQDTDKIQYQRILNPVQSFRNLDSLSMKFIEAPYMTNEIFKSISKILANLPQLKNLKLAFLDFLTKESGTLKQINPIYFEEIFKAISQMTKLEKLHLTIKAFDFENSSHLFQSLCQSLQNLTQLSNFYLRLDRIDLKNQDISLLAHTLCKLTKMQSLHLQISNNSRLQSDEFHNLIQRIVNFLPLLSSLTLDFNSITIIDEMYETLYKAIGKLKNLSRVEIKLRGEIVTTQDMALLNREITSRMEGYISFRNESDH